jgi:hypothetical protein
MNTDAHRYDGPHAQLRIAGLKIGLIVNFGRPKLE